VTVGFFQRVYQVVRMIPRGKVATYGQIAAIVSHPFDFAQGKPRAARTVGWALHALPDGTDVPWQRVINAQGMVSITCELHDPILQRELLEEEGIVFDEEGRVDLERYRWAGLEWPEIEALWREWES
jgi:methylated-DNA-protein-cysteine methyltransferase-like protein